MHTHVKKVYKIIILALVILFVILGLLVINTASLSSLKNKQSSLITSVSTVNNLLQTIKTTSLRAGASSDGGYIINQTNEATVMVREFEYPTANILERLFHFSTANSLDSLNDQAREANSTLNEELNSFNENITALLKFIEYSPAEDFALIGQDTNNDAERTDRAIKAFNDISTNKSLNADQKQQLVLAIAAATEFKQSSNLTKYSESILSAQKDIITQISNSIEQSKTSYNEQYNQLLYQ